MGGNRCGSCVHQRCGQWPHACAPNASFAERSLGIQCAPLCDLPRMSGTGCGGRLAHGGLGIAYRTAGGRHGGRWHAACSISAVDRSCRSWGVRAQCIRSSGMYPARVRSFSEGWTEALGSSRCAGANFIQNSGLGFCSCSRFRLPASPRRALHDLHAGSNGLSGSPGMTWSAVHTSPA